MAAKINWHRYGTKLPHCHRMYWPGLDRALVWPVLSYRTRRTLPCAASSWSSSRAGRGSTAHRRRSRPGSASVLADSTSDASGHHHQCCTHTARQSTPRLDTQNCRASSRRAVRIESATVCGSRPMSNSVCRQRFRALSVKRRLNNKKVKSKHSYFIHFSTEL